MSVGNQHVRKRCIVPQRFGAAEMLGGQAFHTARFGAVFPVSVGFPNCLEIIRSNGSRSGLRRLVQPTLGIHPQRDVIDQQMLGIDIAGKHGSQSTIAHRQCRLDVAESLGSSF